MRTRAWLLLVTIVSLGAAQQSPDEQHWQRITDQQQALLKISPTSQVTEAIAARRTLVKTARAYQNLYPGGERRAASLRIELQTRFEIGTMQSGDLDELRQRCQTLLAERDTRDHPEAAYWLLLCDRKAPGQDSVLNLGTEARAAYERYCQQYPASVYTPRLIEVLFNEAQTAGQTARMTRWVESLEAAHPGHLTSELLRGALDLHNSLGQPFQVTGVSPAGAPIDSRLARGRPALIVFWSSDRPPTELLTRIEQARTRHNLAIFGVDLRPRPEQTTSRPQHWQHLHDRLGPAHRVARRWGIRRLPCILIVDPAGRLAGIGDEWSWEPLLTRAIDSN